MIRTKCIVQAPNRSQESATLLSDKYDELSPTDSVYAGSGGRKKKQLTFGIDPLSVQVRVRRLIAYLLDRFGRFLVDYAAGPPSPSRFGRAHGAG